MLWVARGSLIVSRMPHISYMVVCQRGCCMTPGWPIYGNWSSISTAPSVGHSGVVATEEVLWRGGAAAPPPLVTVGRAAAPAAKGWAAEIVRWRVSPLVGCWCPCAATPRWFVVNCTASAAADACSHLCRVLVLWRFLGCRLRWWLLRHLWLS